MGLTEKSFLERNEEMGIFKTSNEKYNKSDDLISRAAAIAEVEEYLQELDSCISEPDLKLDGYRNGLQVAIQELKASPAIDAISVEWLNQKYAENEPREDKDYDYFLWDAIAYILTEWQKEQEAR